jgi:hypothetical protein
MEGGVVPADDGRGIRHGQIVCRRECATNSPAGMEIGARASDDHRHVPIPDRAATLSDGPPMSQLDLAVRAGTTQAQRSYIEQGRSRPGRNMVTQLSESTELTR